MKKSRLIVLFLMLHSILTAQRKIVVAENRGVDKYHQGAFESKLNEPDPNKSNVKGTRYFQEDYAQGEVITKDKYRYTTEMLYKFDEYKNAVQIKALHNNKELMLFNNTIDTFKLFAGNRVITYIKAEVPDENDPNKLFQAIYLGANTKLIKLPRKKIVKVTNADVFSTGETYDQFESQDWYYLKINDKAFQKIKISKKSLFEILPDKRRLLSKLFDTPQYKGELTDIKLEKLFHNIDNE